MYGSGSALRSDVSGPGYWVFAPARLADGNLVVVNRGFVPEGRQHPTSRAAGQITGPAEMVGVLRWPQRRGLFTATDDPQRNLWFVRDQVAIAAAKGWGEVAPFYIELESPQAPGGLPGRRGHGQPAQPAFAICPHVVRASRGRGGDVWLMAAPHPRRRGTFLVKTERSAYVSDAYTSPPPLGSERHVISIGCADHPLGARGRRNHRIDSEQDLEGPTVRYVSTRGEDSADWIYRRDAGGTCPRRRSVCAECLAALRRADDQKLRRPPLRGSCGRGDSAVRR